MNFKAGKFMKLIFSVHFRIRVVLNQSRYALKALEIPRIPICNFSNRLQ